MDINSKKEIPNTIYHKTIKWLCVFIQAGVFVYLLLIWNRLPDRIPMHYDSAGKVDGYGGRWTVWITPVIMVLMYQFLSLMERHPNWWNTSVSVTEENHDKVYEILKNMIVSLKLIVMLMFGYMSICTGESIGSWFLPVSLVITFGTVLIFLLYL